MEDKCLFNHKISFSKANELRYFKSKRKSKLSPKLLILKLPGQLHAFLSSNRALFNSLLLSVSFYFRSEAVTGRGSCVTGGCADCCRHTKLPAATGAASRSPGRCRHWGIHVPSLWMLSSNILKQPNPAFPLNLAFLVYPELVRNVKYLFLKCKFT